MKKSEAIKKLKAELQEMFCVEYAYFSSGKEPGSDANLIINFCIDELGMRPPLNKSKSFKIGDENGEMTYEVYEWEE